MKNLVNSSIFLIVLMSFSFIACEKENEYIQQLIDDEIEDREAYLEDNGITEDSKTASGLYYIETEEGSGVQPIAGDIVHVHYEGRFLNGSIFDSSYQRKVPIKFTLGQGEVIAGWDEAITLMKEGGTAQLIIPSDLAYGATGNSGIPGYTTLMFYVELVDVE
ncbi:MAG: hypothetical protein B6I20_01825 [Bacteroidetes bacterium 4572_117]|nr:MAG: hypothetical protein B6I20_01825 [Bacteroidetes bacterium 4572_117]